MMSFFQDQRILVLGGTGSIGRQIVRQLQQEDPEVIRIYSRDETKQLQMKEEIAEGDLLGTEVEKEKNIRFLVGDIREQERLERAMRGVDYVLQAAAMKRVDTCEYNPFEAVRTNVVGTENVIRAALRMDVKKVLGISTDKAINPPYVMGATKLLSEKLLNSVNRWTPDLTCACVRFGNVLGSRGSVVPTIIDQIKQGGPVTLTSPEMSRFYVTPNQAGTLALEGLKRSEGGEIYFLTMPVIYTEDLVEVLIDLCAEKFGHQSDSIEVDTIGRRPGEKMHERIVTEEEEYRASMIGSLEADHVNNGETNDTTPFDTRLGKVDPLYQINKDPGSRQASKEPEILANLKEHEVFYSGDGGRLDRDEISQLLKPILQRKHF